ncbi:MAG TPA: DUF5916 domain-containing protein, partial [Fimbriimonadaceae bacterium]|nr:DUF5916 domain-containing protein [Fimbriimonadaceae bacterium]
GFGFAQQTVFPAKALDKPPVIDGVITDEEWGAIPTASGGYDEDTGAPEPYRSQYWLAYDRHFIYIAGRFADPEPKLIHATEYRHNVSLSGDDHMTFSVDPFSTLSDTNQFEVNPQGATNVFIAGGRAAKREWLGEFTAKGRITAAGWEIEARIPWSIMRLPAPGVRDLRVTFGRVLYRTARSYLLDNVSGGKSSNIGVWKQVDVPRSDARRELKLLPYAYAGADRDGGIANAGLDLKAPITSELDLVGSVNPDFRNIENQVLSIDFSYFERLAGESRPFFLEGSDYFRTSLDAPLFVSQRIPNFDAGAKIYGKLNENSTLAILDTADFTHQNNFAGAFRYNFSQHTNSTVAFTDQEMPGLSNRGTFVNFNHDFGPFSFFAQHMTTNDSLEGYGHRYNTGLTYAADGLFNDFEYVEISPHFLPRLGFAPERNMKGFLDIMQYSHPVKLGQINELDGSLGFDLLRTFENTNYRRSANASVGFACKDGASVDLEGNYVEFEGFKDHYAVLSLVRPRNDPYRNAALTVVAGNIAGHSYRSFSPSVSYRPWKNLQLVASYQRVDHFDLQEQSIFSANYDISASDSISGRAIRRGSDTDFYLAFRRTGNRGNEYYLIIGDPNAPTFRASIILKAVFPIGFRF